MRPKKWTMREKIKVTNRGENENPRDFQSKNTRNKKYPDEIEGKRS